ncbi:unnamed protein product [Sphagnum tenellum]
MELGFDAVLLNSAVSLAQDPVKMAEAFALAIQAGLLGYEAGFKMLSPSTTTPPIIWSIAGSDSSGGSGIQADLKTMTALNAHGCTLVTAITSQNLDEVQKIEILSPSSIQSQLSALQGGLSPKAIKIGMLGHIETIQIIARFLNEFPNAVTCDPVLASSSGLPLLEKTALKALKETLFPHVRILTPNLPEAERLVGYPLNTPQLIEKAAADLLSFGVKSVVIKGGHSQGPISQDYWTDGTRRAWLNIQRLGGISARGTGCTFASALAVALAYGFDDLDAAVIAKTFVHQCLRLSLPLLKDQARPTLLRYRSWPATSSDLPWLTNDAESGTKEFIFPECVLPECFGEPQGSPPLGFYPIVDRKDWLMRLLPLGIKTAQLRIKDLSGYELETQIRQSILLARDYQCRLFINDYWDLALKYGAYGVHLGQEDLEGAQIEEISKTHTRLGLSTHCYSEVARAHSIRPSYLAIGPIFPTKIKSMRFSPQGLGAFRIWRELLNYPLVAIGGITLEKSDDLIKAGADGLAVVSDITHHPEPEARAVEWLKKTKNLPKISMISR